MESSVVWSIFIQERNKGKGEYQYDASLFVSFQANIGRLGFFFSMKPSTPRDAALSEILEKKETHRQTQILFV